MTKKTISHSKFKNTGLLFELLAKQITSDIISEQKSKAEIILKKYFKNTELLKEFKLYNYILVNKNSNEDKAKQILQSVIEVYSRIDKNRLNKEKYNLIKEIKNNFDINTFLKNKVESYRELALISNLFEYIDDINLHNITKSRIMELLTNMVNNNTLLEDYKNSDKDLKLLTYRLLLSKFNDKYKNLSESQKSILKEYININESNDSLVNFYNKNIIEIKNKISDFSNKCNDTVVKIKLNEVLKNINIVDKKYKFDNNNLINLMYYCELLDEIKSINE